MEDPAYCRARRRMVEDQLTARGIYDPRVLQAMGAVPREEFVPQESRDSAYSDSALALRLGQTISQPYTVAFMCQALELIGDERVLDIGTGSGYAAAVLSQLASRVFSIERLPDLASEARSRLARLGYSNVSVRVGDGSQGLVDEAPYDAIIVAAAADSLPPALPEQLSEGGRLVLPIGPHAGGQRLRRYVRRRGRLEWQDLGAFAFVPLICGAN